MAEQENLPYWRQGQLAPDQERELDARFQTAQAQATRDVPREELAAAMGVDRGYHQPEPPRRSRLAVAGYGLLGLLLLGGLAAAGYWYADSRGNDVAAGNAVDPDGPTLEAEPVDEATAQELTVGDTDGAAAGDASAGTDGSAEAEGDSGGADTASGDGSTDATATDPATEAGDDPATDAGDDGTASEGGAAAADQSDRIAVIKGGKVYLRGKVPSQEVSDMIEAKAAAVVGPDNVIVEYEIDPSVTIQPGSSAPIYVEDVILFGFNSTEIAPAFYPLLDLGVILLSQNPQASMRVATYTDAVGSEAVNLDVATKRANAVIDYLAAKGVSRDQLEADPKGEVGAQEGVDDATAQMDRRAEFVIIGLLD